MAKPTQLSAGIIGRVLELLPFATVIFAFLTGEALAHFPWLVLDPQGQTVEVYFSETAQQNDPDLIHYMADARLWQLRAGKPEPLKTNLSEQSLTAKLNTKEEQPSLIVLKSDLGVIKRGESTFQLKYYAKTGPAADAGVWRTPASKVLDLDILPEQQGKTIHLVIRWKSQPAEGVQVVVAHPDEGTTELTTDKNGKTSFAIRKPGTYSIRGRHIQPIAGTADGKKYDSIRHYATLALPVTLPGEVSNSGRQYPHMPVTLTSFGGAVLGDAVYAYGGHTGDAHDYSSADQFNKLIRLDLRQPTRWETLAAGPRLQGLAMVPVADKLYRIGGFTAKNAQGEEHDLWSQSSVARFDVQTKTWQDMPALPEPRSSFDAAVVQEVIYVVGGWQLKGDEEPLWHKTAWRLNPFEKKPHWEPLPEPPFQRRALSVAAHDGVLYCVGGMRQQGGPTTRVDIFNPENANWTRGPDLPGKPIEGFGSAAFAAEDKLYVSTVSGTLLRLARDGKSWEQVRKLPTARFFHRMLPYKQNTLLFIGGANMEFGKFSHVDAIQVNQSNGS